MSFCTRRDFLRWCGFVFALSGLSRPAELEIDKLADQMLGKLVLEGDEAYLSSCRVYNPRFQANPKLVAYCANNKDVTAVVRFCREAAFQPVVRSGGHSYAGFSIGPGVVIDVSAMNEIEVLDDSVVVGAGARLGQIYKTLWKDGLTICSGTCPDVGISGITLGGGHGLISRAHGLTIDNLLSLELVNADAETLLVDSGQNEDLYWACRGGGGGNFGVATKFQFRTIPVSTVALYYVQWPPEAAAEALEKWQSWAPQTDPRLSSQLTLRGDGIVSRGLFLGPRQELDSLVDSFNGVSGKKVSTRNADFMSVMEYFGGSSKGSSPPFQAKSDFCNKALSARAVRTVSEHLGRSEYLTATLQLDSYGGAIASVSETDTAFRHRQALFSMQYLAYWRDGQDGTEERAWLKEFYREMRPFVSGGCYRNYPDLDLKNWAQAYYGCNLARLRQLKTKHDPDTFFGFSQSIPQAPS